MLFDQTDKYVPVLLPVLATLVLHVSPALSVCPKPDPKVCAEFFKSETVFVGRVVSQRTAPPDGGFYDGWWCCLSVHKVFRGAARKTIEVFTENSSGRFPLEVGREYLLFASKYSGRLVIDNCGNSGLVSEAKDEIREIGQIGNRSYGTIEGNIVSRPSWTGVGEIRVLARGRGKIYPAITDEEGRFHMTVQPGKYSIQVESPRVSSFDLSYDNPNDFVVPKGGCAQLQFVAAPE